MIPTLRKKQNSELRLLESVPIWMVLRATKEENLKSGLSFWEGKQDDFCGRENKLVPMFLYLPGAKCAAIGAYVVEGGLSRVCLLFPLPFVDDELPLEVGQELEVFLLLGHTHHLQRKYALQLSILYKKRNVSKSCVEMSTIPSAFPGRDSQTFSAGRR